MVRGGYSDAIAGIAGIWYVPTINSTQHPLTVSSLVPAGRSCDTNALVCPQYSSYTVFTNRLLWSWWTICENMVQGNHSYLEVKYGTALLLLVYS